MQNTRQQLEKKWNIVEEDKIAEHVNKPQAAVEIEVKRTAEVIKEMRVFISYLDKKRYSAISPINVQNKSFLLCRQLHSFAQERERGNEKSLDETLKILLGLY